MTYHSKYTRAYRDDILYLIDMRDSHLTHPQKTVIHGLFEPSIARIFCIIMIGEIEATFKNWVDRDNNNILRTYLNAPEGTPNETKINTLKVNFQNHNIEVDPDILNQYLAILYLRNSFAHSDDRSDSQKTYITSQGFPILPENFREKHLAIMYRVNKEMVRYITAVEKDEFNETRYKDYFDKKDLPETSKYFEERNFRGFLWNNIENMDWNVATTPSLMDKKFLKAAIFTWTSYKNMALAGVINFDELQDNIVRLQELIKQPNCNEFPSLDMTNIDNPKKKEFIAELEEKFGIPKDQIALYSQAIAQSKICDNRIKNGCAASLLEKISKEFPAFGNFNFKKESEIANQIFQMLKLWQKFK